MAISIELKVENTTQLTALADHMLRAGAAAEAARMYRTVLKISPDAPHIHARLGLALRPNTRTLLHLDVLQSLERSKQTPFVTEGMATWMKTLPFLDDRRFVELVEKHAHLLPIANWHWQLQTVVWAIEQTKNLAGDLVELGVFKGHTTLFAAEYLQFTDWPKTWWLYDTFEGIPEDQLDTGWDAVNSLTYTPELFDVQEVRDRFAPFKNIKVIQGRVPEVLADHSPEKISFLHMDMNNVVAEIGALDVLYDRIVPGGVIVFDDYGWAVSIAQHRAEKAWFARLGLSILTLPTGQGLFIKHPGT